MTKAITAYNEVHYLILRLFERVVPERFDMTVFFGTFSILIPYFFV
jgi:hypothetical protein